MILTDKEVRSIQIDFWVSALRGAYDNMNTWWLALTIQEPKLSETKVKGRAKLIAKVGAGVIASVAEGIPTDIKAEVLAKYKKSIKEKP